MLIGQVFWTGAFFSERNTAVRFNMKQQQSWYLFKTVVIIWEIFKLNQGRSQVHSKELP